MKQASIEVWRNNANGSRWYHVFDPMGKEITKLVPPRRTFTLTTFERQINQSKVAEVESDPFRNGTFTLQRESEETNSEEFESPDALTDLEITTLILSLIEYPKTAKARIDKFRSPVTMGRIYEGLVLEDAPASVQAAAKEKLLSFEAVVAQERQIISTAATPSPGRGPKMPDKAIAARK